MKAGFWLKLVCVSLLPVILLAMLIYYNSSKILVLKEKEFAAIQIGTVQAQASRVFTQMENILLSLATNSIIIENLQNPAYPVSLEWYRQAQIIESILLASTPIEALGKQFSITIISKENQVFQNGSSTNLSEKIDGSLVNAVYAAGENKLFKRYPFSVSGNYYTIGMGKKIMSDETVLGIAVIEVTNEKLANILSFNAENYLAAIVGENGNLLFTDSALLAEGLPQNLSENGRVLLNGQHYQCLATSKNMWGNTVYAFIPESYIFKTSSAFLKQTIIFIAIIVMLAVAATVVTARSYIRAQEKTRKNLEFKVLQNQISPHMIFNTLNTITNLANLQGMDNIATVSGSFSSLLRIIIQNDNEFITLREEISYVRSYVNIKRYGLLCDCTLCVHIPPHLEDCRILKLLMQPIAENCIKHAFTGLPAGEIRIAVEEADSFIFISVTDNGCGILPEKLSALNEASGLNPETENIGLRNIRGRLKLQYGRRAALSIENTGSGTRVSIRYPKEGNRP